MNRLMRALRQLFGRAAAPTPATISGEIVPRLMKLLADAPCEAFSCEDIHQWVDLYAEALVRGEDVSQLMPLVKMHLEVCPDCIEELQALLGMMQLEQSA